MTNLDSLKKRFWSKVNKNGPVHPVHGECWEWTASKAREYGLFTWLNRKLVTAHRASWCIHHGEFPKKFVLHKCDNPLCVNPDHLFLGDVKDNARDMIVKGRKCNGVCTVKLSNRQIEEIKTRLCHNESRSSLAKEFGVSKTKITRIRKLIAVPLS